MTYEERKKWVCEQCNENANCPYIPRQLEDKCQNISDTMYGWELGYRDAIEKAVEWIKQFAYNSVVTDHVGEREKQAIIVAFKQAMEENE
jgi:hypothetical protein